jgi:hypothetical protein
MGIGFWVRRFATVLALAFAVIASAQWLKGHDLAYSATQGAIWGAIAATIFTVTRVVRSRRGEHCELCRDTPELRARDP